MIRQGLFGAVVAVFITVSFAYGEEVFKEPVLLWERKFSPPIREISDQNSDGDFLAVQVKKDEGSGDVISQKLLVIDSKGKTKREELLPKKKKVTIPADQLWLTADSDEELAKLKKAKKPKQMDAQGREMLISGNGEYYATVVQYEHWYEFTYKSKNGKTLWKINPKDNYGFWKAYISYDGSRIVIVDVGGLSGGHVWEVLGQRVYFYDKTGKLLKDYDFGEKEDEWLGSDGTNVRLSLKGKYIAMTRSWGKNPDKSVVLFDASGNILWEKSFMKRHRIGTVTDSGNISAGGFDNPLLSYFIGRTGELISILQIGIDDVIQFAPSGNRLYAIRKKAEGNKENDWLIAKSKFQKHSIPITEIPLEKIKPPNIKHNFVSYVYISPNGEYILSDFVEDTLLPSKGFYNHAIFTLYDKNLGKLCSKELTVKKSGESIFASFLGLSDVFMLRDLNNKHIRIYAPK